MKYIKKFETYEYDKELEEEIDRIVSNYDPIVVKYEDNGEMFFVLVKDKNSDFISWVDLWEDSGEITSDWNQMVYNTNNSNDIIKKGVESDPNVYDLTYSISLDKLLRDEMIYYDDEDNNSYYHTNYWYIKDGYKERGISLEDAKQMRKYNL